MEYFNQLLRQQVLKIYTEIMNKRYTIAQFRKYLESQDSLGDIYYYLNEENVDKANEPKDESDEGNFYL